MILKFYSTKNRSLQVSLHVAVQQGIAPDGGLFMPVEIPRLSPEQLRALKGCTFQEIAEVALRPFLQPELTPAQIGQLVQTAFNFEVPLRLLHKRTYVLELFHGPTLAFKDFGARFMAQLLKLLFDRRDKEITILVATSGDTGSAVARGFYGQKGVRVVLLYPSGKVSAIQEKQLTTLRKNVIAVEVKGDFDDCQRLVKMAFADSQLNEKLLLTSANSINIARLLPQALYYLYAGTQLECLESPLVFSVPSGNLGNLTGGLLARAMGLPVQRFVAALNSNRVFYHYLQTGAFRPAPVVPTISNAMDVGNPSNFFRILDLFNGNWLALSEVIYGASFSDEQTLQAIRQVYGQTGYVFDPHGAVGYLGLQHYLHNMGSGGNNVVLATAHPAKFKDVIERSIDCKTSTPQRLISALRGKKRSVQLSANFAEFKEWLLAEQV